MSDRAAWNSYWAAFAIFVGVVVMSGWLRGSGLLWGLALAIPLLASGASLVLFSAAHARVCAIEVARHAWLRVLTMGGYGRGTFFLTGVFEIVFAVALGAYVAAR